jgi:hypothetical protein
MTRAARCGIATAALAALALALVTGTPSASAAPARCLLGKSARLADVTTRKGQRIELFEGQLRIDGRLESACDGLPGGHPVAVAPFRDGFAVAFRDAPLSYWEGGQYHPLAGAPTAVVRALGGADGVLWIGTANDGLWRMEDGAAKRVRAFGTSGITALAPLAGASGRVLVGLDSGGYWEALSDGSRKVKRGDAYVGCFRPRAGAMAPVAPGPGCRQDEGAGVLPSAEVTSLAFHRGAMHVGTFAGGVFRLAENGEAHVIEAAPTHVDALLSVGERLFIGAADGLYVADGDAPAARVPLGVPLLHVNDLAAGADGTIWMATNRGLLGYSDGAVRVLDDSRGLPSSMAYAVAVAADGAVWVGTARGAARLATGSGPLTFGTYNGRLAHDWVTALVVDGSSVEAGTYDAGVFRLAGDGASDAVPAFGGAWVNPHALARIGGHLVAGTMGTGILAEGLGGAFRTLPSRDVTAIVEHAGRVWIGTRGGIAIY